MKKSLKRFILPVILGLCLLMLCACGENTDNGDMQSTVPGTMTGGMTDTMTETAPSTAADNTSIGGMTGTDDSQGTTPQVGEGRNYGSYSVYYPNQGRTGLIRRDVEYTKDYAEDFMGRVRESINELVSRSDADYAPLGSSDKNIKSISLDQQGVLVIDFEQEFFDNVSKMDMPDNAAIYGLVNTLAQYSEIRSVKFTVEGKPMVWNNEELTKPISENTQISVEE